MYVTSPLSWTTPVRSLTTLTNTTISNGGQVTINPGSFVTMLPSTLTTFRHVSILDFGFATIYAAAYDGTSIYGSFSQPIMPGFSIAIGKAMGAGIKNTGGVATTVYWVWIDWS